MKAIVNKENKSLFISILISIILFNIFSFTIFFLKIKNSAIIISIASLCMGIFILLSIYKYLKEQDRIIEDAISKIRKFLSDSAVINIKSDEEGELYRLFHEINSLGSILNTDIRNREKEKEFLKNTISDISHQLKTPLAALNIYNGIIQNDREDAMVIEEFAVLSENELDRIEILIQNLLKVTKFDTGTIIIDKKMENISEMMNYIVDHFQYRLKDEEKELILLGNVDDLLLCDKNWIIEAISNIVKNALDHTTKGNIIEIKWKKTISMVQITISDNGYGIHSEDIYHIFKRFYRSRFSKDTQGIGLGLPLVKSIVEVHNGTIEVDSELGKGTKFTINFLIPTEL